jgi:hypothetical protein
MKTGNFTKKGNRKGNMKTHFLLLFSLVYYIVTLLPKKKLLYNKRRRKKTNNYKVKQQGIKNPGNRLTNGTSTKNNTIIINQTKQMGSKLKYTIENHEGVWEHHSTTISELGFILVKFYNVDKKVYMNVNMGLLEDALQLPWSKSKQN